MPWTEALLRMWYTRRKQAAEGLEEVVLGRDQSKNTALNFG